MRATSNRSSRLILVGSAGGGIIGGLTVAATSIAAVIGGIVDAMRYNIPDGIAYQITNWVIAIIVGVLIGAVGGAAVAGLEFWLAGFGKNKGRPIGVRILCVNIGLSAITCFVAIFYFSLELHFANTLGMSLVAPSAAAIAAAFVSWFGQTVQVPSAASRS